MCSKLHLGTMSRGLLDGSRVLFFCLRISKWELLLAPVELGGLMHRERPSNSTSKLKLWYQQPWPSQKSPYDFTKEEHYHYESCSCPYCVQAPDDFSLSESQKTFGIWAIDKTIKWRKSWHLSIGAREHTSIFLNQNRPIN